MPVEMDYGNKHEPRGFNSEGLLVPSATKPTRDIYNENRERYQPYGEEDPRLIILHLVIDDGTPGRGHRLNLLDKDYRLIGVAMGSHPEWKFVCVMNFVDDLK